MGRNINYSSYTLKNRREAKLCFAKYPFKTDKGECDFAGETA